MTGLSARLRLFAQARDAAGRSSDEFAAVTLGDLLDQACARYGPRFEAVLGRSKVWINGDEPGEGRAAPLAPGDEVAVLPPVSGG